MNNTEWGDNGRLICNNAIIRFLNGLPLTDAQSIIISALIISMGTPPELPPIRPLYPPLNDD